MANSRLTTSDIKKIILKVWAENDEPITLPGYAPSVKWTCVTFIDALFYTFTKEIKGSRTLALIETVGEESASPSNADYSERTVKVVMSFESDKAETLDYYVQKLRNVYRDNLQDFSELLNKPIKGFLRFGILQYDRDSDIESTGRVIRCSFEVKVTYTTNVVISGQKVWLLDGEKLPYVDEGVDLDKSGATNTIYGAKATQTVPAVQSRFYRFSLPYISDNPVCRGLQRDILDGDMQKIYTLTFYDGVVYTEAEPLTVKVTLFRTSKSAGKITASTTFDVWFAEADDNTKGRVQYEMALIDNAFDSECLNTRWFASQAEQQAWFKIRTDATTAPYRAIKAPNIGSLTISMQTYFAPLNASLDSLLTKNYAVIKATEGEAVRYYYYFVTSANVGADNQISVNLQMDVVQTYYFNPNIEIGDCLINRACLDRWVYNADGTVTFNGREDSPLLNTLGTDCPKRLVKREQLKFKWYDDTALNNWLHENVAYWQYVFLKGNQLYGTDDNLPNVDGTTKAYKSIPTTYSPSVQTEDINRGVVPGWSVLCFPVYKKNGARILFYNKLSDMSIAISPRGFKKFLELNNNTSYFFGIKASVKPPFFGVGVTSHTISNSGLFLTMDDIIPNEESFPIFPVRTHYFLNDEIVGVLFCNAFNLQPHNSDSYITSNPVSFSKTDIKNGLGKNLNPQLLNNEFKEIRVTNGIDGYFTYDQQKLNANSLVFKYYEAITPDITRQYLAYEGDDTKGLYITDTSRNYTGLVTSLDASVPYTNDQFGAFLAQNKNFYLQRNINTGMDIFKNAVSFMSNVQSGAASLAMGATTGNVGQIAGGVQSLNNTGINAMMSAAQIAVERVQSNLTLDNMRSAPGTLNSANGSVLFNISVSELGFYIEEYSALETDLRRANDYMNMFGYSVKRVGNIKDYDKIRIKHNYIEAEIETISGNISDEARNMLKRIFKQGIRFWRQDLIEYSNNYEQRIND